MVNIVSSRYSNKKNITQGAHPSTACFPRPVEPLTRTTPSDWSLVWKGQILFIIKKWGQIYCIVILWYETAVIPSYQFFIGPVSDHCLVFFSSQKSLTDFSLLLGLMKMPTVMPDGDAKFNAKADVDAVVSAAANLCICHLFCLLKIKRSIWFCTHCRWCCKLALFQLILQN